MNSPLLTQSSDDSFEGEYEFLQPNELGADDTVTIDQQEKIVVKWGCGNHPVFVGERGDILGSTDIRFPRAFPGEIVFASLDVDTGSFYMGDGKSDQYFESIFGKFVPRDENAEVTGLSSSAAWAAASSIVLKDSTPMDEWEKRAAADALWREFE
ncbi:MAG: hypothetical protein WDN28_10180, partial [Chthoniobacter sp.]